MLMDKSLTPQPHKSVAILRFVTNQTQSRSPSIYLVLLLTALFMTKSTSHLSKKYQIK